tara:strand:- start:774 stop:1130 length:357 start_codon:yes stop_codon:yes gene_type:complete
MNKDFETVFIMNPVLSEDQQKRTVNKYKKLLESNEAKIICNENLGFKNLSYPIKNKKTGFYHLFQYISKNKDIVKSFETEFRRDDKILRYLTVSLCKDALIYNERRSKGEFKKKKNEK